MSSEIVSNLGFLVLSKPKGERITLWYLTKKLSPSLQINSETNLRLSVDEEMTKPVSGTEVTFTVWGRSVRT